MPSMTSLLPVHCAPKLVLIHGLLTSSVRPSSLKEICFAINMVSASYFQKPMGGT